uniref:ADP-ribosyl cyclase/cyclic ADP-ribose hydrolase n=1 Tax=Knipowitschia caucasica TaxID=637954 RepID=A0AAV2L9R0_KNICA
MEEAQMQRKTKSRKRRCFILILVIVIVVVCAVVLGLILQRTRDFKSVFTSRCVEYGGYDCEKTWSTFEQAYMGKDPCQVPPESYQALIEAAPIKPACNRVKTGPSALSVAENQSDQNQSDQNKSDQRHPEEMQLLRH